LQEADFLGHNIILGDSKEENNFEKITRSILVSLKEYKPTIILQVLKVHSKHSENNRILPSKKILKYLKVIVENPLKEMT
jgi:hypothetical protein